MAGDSLYCYCNSLCCRDPSGRPNQYVTAIQAVGEIIQVSESEITADVEDDSMA